MSDIKIITNLPDFISQLSKFSDDLRRKVFRAGTSAAAAIFVKAARAKAPILKRFDTRKKNPRIVGNLRKNIYQYRSRETTPGKWVFKVSFRKGKKAAIQKRDAFYGKFLEAGWLPRGPGKRIRGGSRTKNLIRSRATENKITKYRFLMPAFAAQKLNALNAFTARVQKRIDLENSKR